MKKIIQVMLTSIPLILTLMACKSKKAETSNSPIPEKETTTLVIYYSQTGVTKKVAEELQKRLEADIDSIVPIHPYSGSYDDTIERGFKELESGDFPDIKPLLHNPADYDVIFLCYPIWFGTYANPVATFLKQNDLSGKKIVPFTTFGSGGLESSVRNIELLQSGADVVPGYGVREIRIEKMPAELDRFLIEEGFIEGKVEPLPDFSSPVAVTPETESVFNQACSDYKFPLGKPVMVASRQLRDGITEYKYSVESSDHEGNTVESTIYVLSSENGKPVFTRVVR